MPALTHLLYAYACSSNILTHFFQTVSPDFGFVPMNEHLSQDHHHHYNKVTGDL